MQINSIQNSPNFNGIKFKSLNDLNLIQGFKRNNRLDPTFHRVYRHQLENPVHINIDKSDNPKYLLFKVGEKIFKSNFFRSNIETLELASKYADKLNPNNKLQTINFFA